VRRSVLVGCATAIVGIIAACSSFDETEDAPPAPASDAGSEGSPGDSSDGDAGAGADAGADAAQPFCKTDSGTFCEDFDDPGSAAFPDSNLWDGGTLAFVADPHFSPPKALRATFANPTDSTCRYAVLKNAGLDAPIPNGYRIEYRIFAKTIPGRLLHGATVGTRDTNTANRCSIFMETLAGPGATLIVEPQTDQLPAQDIQLSRKILPGQWSHVEIDVKGPAGARRASVVIDGATAVSDTMLTTSCQAMDRLYEVTTGLICVNADALGDLDVAFDDIRVIAY